MCIYIYLARAQSSTNTDDVLEELPKFEPHSRKGNSSSRTEWSSGFRFQNAGQLTGRMRFAVANKAYMAVTLGAAIELKEQVAKPCSSAAKRGIVVPVLAARSSSSAGVGGGGEESLRVVMYLSCWGPS